jgi:fibronectin type III domain protein
MTKLFRVARGLAVSFAMAAVLAACGGGSTSSQTTQSGPPPPPPPPTSGSVILNWTIPTLNTDGSMLTNLAGFKVIYGQSSANLSQSVSITNATVSTYQIDNLTSGTWYFAIVTVASDGTESAPTNLLSQTI